MPPNLMLSMMARHDPIWQHGQAAQSNAGG